MTQAVMICSGGAEYSWYGSEFLALKHESSIIGHSSNPVCGFSMMEQVRLCAVWPMENWLGSSMNRIQSWITVWECCCHALGKGCLPEVVGGDRRYLHEFRIVGCCCGWRRRCRGHRRWRPGSGESDQGDGDEGLSPVGMKKIILYLQITKKI